MSWIFRRCVVNGQQPLKSVCSLILLQPLKMAGQDNEVNGSLQVNSGDSELDKKVEEWLLLDKVGSGIKTYGIRSLNGHQVCCKQPEFLWLIEVFTYMSKLTVVFCLHEH